MLAYAAFYAQAYVIFNAAVFKSHGTHGAVFNAKAAFYAFLAVNLYFGGYAQFAADDEKQDDAGENVPRINGEKSIAGTTHAVP